MSGGTWEVCSRWPGSSCVGLACRADPPWGSGECWRTESCRSEASAAHGSSCSCGFPGPGPALPASIGPSRVPPAADLPVRLPAGAGGTGCPWARGHPGARPYLNYQWIRPCTFSTWDGPGHLHQHCRHCQQQHLRHLPLLPRLSCGTESLGTGSSALGFPPDRWQPWLCLYLGLTLIQDWHSWKDCPVLPPFSLHPLSSLLSQPHVHLDLLCQVYSDFLYHHH